jgi:hypothetical protein
VSTMAAPQRAMRADRLGSALAFGARDSREESTAGFTGIAPVWSRLQRLPLVSASGRPPSRGAGRAHKAETQLSEGREPGQP